MAKKKKKAAKTKTKAKARKKLSVKKRPVKDLDARKGKSVKGGIVIGTRALNFSKEVVTADKISPGALYQKIQ